MTLIDADEFKLSEIGEVDEVKLSEGEVRLFYNATSSSINSPAPLSLS